MARSTFYYHHNVHSGDDKFAQLKQEIRATYDRHKGRYGYRRITMELKATGQRINHKKVYRLMTEAGLKSLVRVKKYRSYQGEVGKAALHILERDFKAKNANEKWVTDVTEFKVGGEKLYLSPIMDLYNGEIIAYEMSRRPVFELVGNMLGKAIGKLKPGEKPLLHSDQGWHYRMPMYRNILHQQQMGQSMSRKGNCLDNAAMESFFAVLKTELFYLNKFNNIDELRNGIDEYMQYYNHDRIKMKLNGLSPVQYRLRNTAN
jgi:transposase InsO family protein